MVSINASDAAAAFHLPNEQGNRPRPTNTLTFTTTPNEIVDSVALSQEAKALVESGVAPTRSSNSAVARVHEVSASPAVVAAAELPFDDMVRAIAQGNGATLIAEPRASDRGPVIAEQSGEPFDRTGGTTPDTELLAEATLIEKLLDSNEDEDEPLRG